MEHHQKCLRVSVRVELEALFPHAWEAVDGHLGGTHEASCLHTMADCAFPVRPFAHIVVPLEGTITLGLTMCWP